MYFKDDPKIHLFKDIMNIYKNQNFEKFVIVGKNWWLEEFEPLEYIDIKVDVILDNDSKKWNDFSKIPIKPVGYARELGDSAIYMISNKAAKELRNQLETLGIKSNRIFEVPLYGAFKEALLLEKEKEINTEYRKLSLREVQEIELNILKEFKNKCDQWGLKYFITFGTLIGAIRHQGFIPWDDDIDVLMPYEDYRKFVELYEDNDDFELLDWTKNDDYSIRYAKLTKKDTLIFHGDGMFMGVYIDIFPLAGYPETQDEIEEKCRVYKELDNEWRKYFLRKEMGLECEDCRKKVMDQKCQYSFYNSKIVGDVEFFYNKPLVVPKDHFSHGIEKEFEKEKFMVPVGYDEYLKAIYGDYITPPPPEERLFHGYPSYIKRR